MGRKRKLQDADEEEGSGEVDLPPSHLSVGHLRKEEKRLIVVLEKAQLETAKVTPLTITIIGSCNFYNQFVKGVEMNE